MTEWSERLGVELNRRDRLVDSNLAGGVYRSTGNGRHEQEQHDRPVLAHGAKEERRRECLFGLAVRSSGLQGSHVMAHFQLTAAIRSGASSDSARAGVATRLLPSVRSTLDSSSTKICSNTSTWGAGSSISELQRKRRLAMALDSGPMGNTTSTKSR